MTSIKPGSVSFAPGRICLFGEHQDYLNFPVIAASIDLG
nr:galactokinase family protein [Candidatus Sigynarchaeota archaeon]